MAGTEPFPLPRGWTNAARHIVGIHGLDTSLGFVGDKPTAHHPVVPEIVAQAEESRLGQPEHVPSPTTQTPTGARAANAARSPSVSATRGTRVAAVLT